MTVLFHPNGSMFNNVDTTNVIANSNDETVTIPAGYYTLSEIIALLNTMTETLFSISTNASSFEFVTIFVVSTLLNIALASLGRNRAVMEVMVGFLYGLIHVNEPLVGEPRVSME